MDLEKAITTRASREVIKSIRKKKKKIRVQRYSRGYEITEKGEEQIVSMSMSDGTSLDACSGCQHQHSSNNSNDKEQSDYCDNQMNASQDQQELSQSKQCCDGQDDYQEYEKQQQESLCQEVTNDNDDGDISFSQSQEAQQQWHQFMINMHLNAQREEEEQRMKSIEVEEQDGLAAGACLNEELDDGLAEKEEEDDEQIKFDTLNNEEQAKEDSNSNQFRMYDLENESISYSTPYFVVTDDESDNESDNDDDDDDDDDSELNDDTQTMEAQDNGSDYEQNESVNNDRSDNQEISRLHLISEIIYRVLLDRNPTMLERANDENLERSVNYLDNIVDQLVQELQTRKKVQGGLTAQQIERIPVIEHSTIEHEEGHHIYQHKSCSICLCEFANKELVKLLGCDHIFHINCIDQWLTSKSSCPICRQIHK